MSRQLKPGCLAIIINSHPKVRSNIGKTVEVIRLASKSEKQVCLSGGVFDVDRSWSDNIWWVTPARGHLEGWLQKYDMLLLFKERILEGKDLLPIWDGLPDESLQTEVEKECHN